MTTAPSLQLQYQSAQSSALAHDLPVGAAVDGVLFVSGAVSLPFFPVPLPPPPPLELAPEEDPEPSLPPEQATTKKAGTKRAQSAPSSGDLMMRRHEQPSCHAPHAPAHPEISGKTRRMRARCASPCRPAQERRASLAQGPGAIRSAPVKARRGGRLVEGLGDRDPCPGDRRRVSLRLPAVAPSRGLSSRPQRASSSTARRRLSLHTRRTARRLATTTGAPEPRPTSAAARRIPSSRLERTLLRMPSRPRRARSRRESSGPSWLPAALWRPDIKIDHHFSTIGRRQRELA